MRNRNGRFIANFALHISHFRNPPKQCLSQLIPIAAMRGAPGAPHAEEQRDRDDQKNDIRRPHRQERRKNERVAQFLAADQADVIDGEHRQARPDHESHAAARIADRERHAEQREDHAGGGDRQLLLNLDFVDRRALARRAEPLVVSRRRLRRVREVRDGAGRQPPSAPAPRRCLGGLGGARANEPRDRAEHRAVRDEWRGSGVGGWDRGGERREPGDLAQLGGDRRERLDAHALLILPGPPDDVLHRADRHLAIAAVLVVLGQLQVVADAHDLDAIDRVKRSIEVLRIGALDLVHFAVAERQVQVGPAAGVGHAAGVGQDDAPPVGVLQIVNRHIAQRVRGRVDAGGAQEELARHDFVDHLFFQLKRRLLPLDIDEERPQRVVRAGQDLIVPDERDDGDQCRAAEHGREHAADADPARFHRRDLVVGGEMTERVQDGNEHRHRQRHRYNERNRQREHFEDDAPGEAFADEVAELLRDLIDEHRARQRRERIEERRNVLPQDVTAQDAHGWSRHYIRNPKSLQGMRRLAQLVGLAFTLVVPRVHAQAPVYTFGVPPLAPPRHPALAPGGRLGARVPPALVAQAWGERVLARRPPVFGAPGTVSAALLPPSAAPSPPLAAAPYAELGMQLNLRLELKADQFRNLRCTSQEVQLTLSGCNSGFPTITPNPQYAIRSAGVVGERLHVDVDFDSQREFDANNNLHVWYEGLEDEVLRRVEAGNVTFQAPPSRFITAQVPANNFGIQAIAQVGPLELRGILAQQKGNIVKDRFYSVGDVTSQPLDREARDLDYESGRFFFVIDPAAVPAYPALDILQLDQVSRPDSLTVGALRVYRRRAVAPSATGNQNVGGVRAVACAPGLRAVDCSIQREGPFEWEILQEGKDYYVDPTGTWFALANRLDQSDYLAASYISASRTDSVGTFPVDARSDTAVVDTLRLLYDPKPAVTAASPTFRFEIRNAYRVGGREIDRTSVALTLSVNQRERGARGDTYLQRLGLALENDGTQFDQYNRLFPRTRDPNQGDPVRDLFIVFPHLIPFADSTRLSATERNDSLYRTPRAYLATQGPPSVFTLRLHADATASPDRSLLSLNSFQIREGSERLYLGTRLLTRETDYTIDYTTGQVQFKNPDALFQGGSAQIRAQFEERAAFSLAPTTTYGLSARYDLGAVGQECGAFLEL